MNTIIFKELVQHLKGINYFFISGLSVSIHTNGQRIPGDIDIAIHPNDIELFAERLGAKAHPRHIHKGTFIVDDYGFEVEYKGQMVECTTGYPLKRINENTFNKLFEMKVAKLYLDEPVYVEPLEELVNQKAFMHRDKDMKDLELLKSQPIHMELLNQIGIDKGNNEIVLPVVKVFFDTYI